MLRTLSGTDGRYHSRAAPWGAIRAWRAGLVSRRCVLVCLFTNFIEFCIAKFGRFALESARTLTPVLLTV